MNVIYAKTSFVKLPLISLQQYPFRLCLLGKKCFTVFVLRSIVFMELQFSFSKIYNNKGAWIFSFYVCFVLFHIVAFITKFQYLSHDNYENNSNFYFYNGTAMRSNLMFLEKKSVLKFIIKNQNFLYFNHITSVQTNTNSLHK